jgi:RNA polymerase sigma-70 factor (ECF subfamily)
VAQTERPADRAGQRGRAYLFRTANNMVLDHARSSQRSMARDRGWIEIDGPAPAMPEDRPDPAPDAEERSLVPRRLSC